MNLSSNGTLADRLEPLIHMRNSTSANDADRKAATRELEVALAHLVKELGADPFERQQEENEVDDEDEMETTTVAFGEDGAAPSRFLLGAIADLDAIVRSTFVVYAHVCVYLRVFAGLQFVPVYFTGNESKSIPHPG